jgi:hypothetical protein
MQEIKEGDRVRIKSISDGQHHLKVGDGETYFLNKEATVSHNDDTKVYIYIDGFDYVLWFVITDLEKINT